MANYPKKVWINGHEDKQIDVLNRGLAYADGLFETIAVESGYALLLDAHIARLRKGAEVLSLSCDFDALIADIKAVAEHVERGDRAVLKVVLVRESEGGRGYRGKLHGKADTILKLFDWPSPPDRINLKACKSHLGRDSMIKGLKTINALEYVLASNELSEQWHEGVLCDSEGYIVENTRSNLFWVNQNGVLVTPDLKYCGVKGVVRDEILKRAPAQGVPVKVTLATLDALENAREIFVTNSLVGVQSVAKYEERELGEFSMAQTIHEILKGAIFEDP